MVAVGPNANPLDDPADVAALAEHAEVLLRAVDGVLGLWVVRVVRLRWCAWADDEPSLGLISAAAAAGDQAREAIVPSLGALLRTDVDAQPSNPLSLLRAAIAYPTQVLADAGVPDVVRDPDAERLFPDDRYDLTPGSFSDIDESLHDPGLAWGAAKAHVVLARRRRGGAS
ncbi:MAG: hypothetical protein WD691_04405 [Acidimicrobiales bacterium]